MLLFENQDYSLELDILGYSSPTYEHHSPGVIWTANWLDIFISVRHPKGSWAVTDPCLPTFEVRQLADWFEQINSNTTPQMMFFPTDPCLHFKVLINEFERKTLRVYFELEVRPAWASTKRGELRNDLWVEFSLDEINLSEAANHLRELLKKYSQRAFRNS